MESINQSPEELEEAMRQLQETLEIRRYILNTFIENYELLAAETGSGLAPAVKAAALAQVNYYWRKMNHVARKVTDTEVRLSLPNQKTPKGTVFTIQGVVDIIRDNDRTIMYDIKTHDAGHVEANRELYSRQLNVYAHIWQTLRSRPLNATRIIATDFPEKVKEADTRNDKKALEYELEQWNPEVDIPFSQQQVAQTIADFARVVDCIEEGLFSPPTFERLKQPLPGSSGLFVNRVCARCDARFSCDAFLSYHQGRQPKTEEKPLSHDEAQWISAGIKEGHGLPPEDFEEYL